MYWLVPRLVQQIELSVVQSTELYGAELWWGNQKIYECTIEQLLNRQARSITGIYARNPIYPLIYEAGLISTSIHLDFCQKSYVHRLWASQTSTLPKKFNLPVWEKEMGGINRESSLKIPLYWHEIHDPHYIGNGLHCNLPLSTKLIQRKKWSKWKWWILIWHLRESL